MCLRSTILIIIISVSFIWCIQVIPEHTKVSYVNEKYLENVKLYIKRYGRKSPYYFNYEGTNKQLWDNNVTIHLIFFEYLHNEYRRSFVEAHYKVCDLLDKEPYIGGMLKVKGITCPLLPIEYQVKNITFPTENFPNVFPFEKGRVEIELSLTKTGETMFKGYLDALFKDVRKPPKLSKTGHLGSK